ncbi:MAG: DUF1292 domain-containing protein [Lachnospiraceae bacterium]|nr:DUF1292 domain-containing protein [Lachnospiraceae bacterium]
MDSVQFTQEDGSSIDYYVLAEAKVGQYSYLLCTEEEEGDAEAFVLRAELTGEEEEGDILYESVTDDKELLTAIEALGKQLDDVEIEL